MGSKLGSSTWVDEVKYAAGRRTHVPVMSATHHEQLLLVKEKEGTSFQNATISLTTQGDQSA